MRTFDEMCEHFIFEVAKMQIEDRYKIQLVGMISVIQTVGNNSDNCQKSKDGAE